MAEGDPRKGTEKGEGKPGVWNYGHLGTKKMEGTASQHNRTGTLSIDCRPLETTLALNNQVNYIRMALTSSYSIMDLLAKPLNQREDYGVFTKSGVVGRAAIWRTGFVSAHKV